jgi:hypothetical protein
MPGNDSDHAPAPSLEGRRKSATSAGADHNMHGSNRGFSAQLPFSRTRTARTTAPLPLAGPRASARSDTPLIAGGCGIPNSTVTEADSQVAEARANHRDHHVQIFLRRPGRGRRALRLTARVFLRLLTRPPLRPFSLLARFLAALRTKPPRRPSATACGFLRLGFFFITPLHSTTSRGIKLTLIILPMLIV